MGNRSRDELAAQLNPFGVMGRMIGDEAREPETIEVVPENALIQLDDGSIQQGNFILTRTGLMLTGELEKPEWEHVGDLLRRLDGAIQWLLGDYLAYSERVFGKTYEQFAFEWGKDAKTLRNYVWVATHVEMSLRRDKLTFSHHSLVAGMQPSDQDYYLAWAAERGVSVVRLAAKIRKDQDVPALPSKPAVDPLVYDRQKFARLSFKRFNSYIQGELHLSPKELQSEGREIIEWVQRVMNSQES